MHVATSQHRLGVMPALPRAHRLILGHKLTLLAGQIKLVCCDGHWQGKRDGARTPDLPIELDRQKAESSRAPLQEAVVPEQRPTSPEPAVSSLDMHAVIKALQLFPTNGYCYRVHACRAPLAQPPSLQHTAGLGAHRGDGRAPIDVVVPHFRVCIQNRDNMLRASGRCERRTTRWGVRHRRARTAFNGRAPGAMFLLADHRNSLYFELPWVVC